MLGTAVGRGGLDERRHFVHTLAAFYYPVFSFFLADLGGGHFGFHAFGYF